MIKKIITICSIVIIVSYISYLIIQLTKYDYSNEIGDYKSFSWIFKDSIKQDIDTTFTGGHSRRTDVLHSYIYKREFFILIWEIYNLKNVKLEEIKFRENSDIDNIDLLPEVIFDIGGDVEEHVKLGPFFKDFIEINYDKQSKILEKIEGDNYSGFYGQIKRMTFSDKTRHLVVINCPTLRNMLLLLYKRNDSFYILMIDSKKQFSASIIDILNLK